MPTLNMQERHSSLKSGRAVSMGVVSVQKGSKGNHSRIRGKDRESLVFTEVWPRAGADKRE